MRRRDLVTKVACNARGRAGPERGSARLVSVELQPVPCPACAGWRRASRGVSPDADTLNTAARWRETGPATAMTMRAPRHPLINGRPYTLNLGAPRGAPLLPRSPATPEREVEVLVRKSATRFLRSIRTGLSYLAGRDCFRSERPARWRPIGRARHPGGHRTAHLVLAPVHNDPGDNRRRLMS